MPDVESEEHVKYNEPRDALHSGMRIGFSASELGFTSTPGYWGDRFMSAKVKI